MVKGSGSLLSQDTVVHVSGSVTGSRATAYCS